MTYREDDQSQAVERQGKADADVGESCTNTTTVSLDGGGEISSSYAEAQAYGAGRGVGWRLGG